MPLTPSTKLSSYEIVAAISPTLSRDATRAGVILGTAVYTSPEHSF